MKLVVGFGNPGRKYEGTRHNIGFVVIDEVARVYQAGKRKAAFQGETAEIQLGSVKTLLLWPHTFMNASGGSVLAARDFYKLTNEELLVVSDDINLPLGKLRFRASGSSGGQKGLEDILRRLGTEKLSRLRIGVGSPPPEFDARDFVLSKFRKVEAAPMAEAVELATIAVADWAREGINFCMNRYN